jgi:hypothetical protein
MNAPVFETRKIGSVARGIVLAVAALALAACETDGTSPSAADAPKAQVASARPDAPAPRAESSKGESSKGEASRTEAAKPEAPKPEAPKTQAVKPTEPAADSEPMTHSRAARECWMKTEKSSAHLDLDRRADIVNKCIDEKMKAAAASAPKT